MGEKVFRVHFDAAFKCKRKNTSVKVRVRADPWTYGSRISSKQWSAVGLLLDCDCVQACSWHR